MTRPAQTPTPRGLTQTLLRDAQAGIMHSLIAENLGLDAG